MGAVVVSFSLLAPSYFHVLFLLPGNGTSLLQGTSSVGPDPQGGRGHMAPGPDPQGGRSHMDPGPDPQGGRSHTDPQGSRAGRPSL